MERRRKFLAKKKKIRIELSRKEDTRYVLQVEFCFRVAMSKWLNYMKTKDSFIRGDRLSDYHVDLNKMKHCAVATIFAMRMS